MNRIFSFGLGLLFLNCSQPILQTSGKTKFVLQPTIVQIEIDSLSSISSRKLKDGETEEKEIEKELINIKRWVDERAKNHLISNQINLTKNPLDAFKIEIRILDLGEVRPRIFLEGISIGLVFGLVTASVSGDNSLGLAVFASEVLEEFIILKVLKGFFSIATIELTLVSPQGDKISNREFRTYRNTEYSDSISEAMRDSEEVRIRSSLDSSLRSMSQYLSRLK